MDATDVLGAWCSLSRLGSSHIWTLARITRRADYRCLRAVVKSVDEAQMAALGGAQLSVDWSSWRSQSDLAGRVAPLLAAADLGARVWLLQREEFLS